MSSPQVSVLIPTYNQQSFIVPCLESVLKQDDVEIEIIVGDDASTDGTVAILQDYKEKYPHMITLLLNATNQGITNNFQQIYHQTSGKYIAWLGGDDIMLPGKLKKQVALMEQHADAAFCYHNVDVFESESDKTLYYYNAPERGYHTSFTGDVTQPLLLYRMFCCACSIMLRRSACPNEGFNLQIPIMSDWLFMLETSLQGKAYYIDEVLSRYRRHANNITKLTTDCSEEEQIYAIFSEKHPEFLSDIKKGRTRMRIFFAIKNLKRKKIMSTLKLLKNAFVDILTAPSVIGFVLHSLFQGWHSAKRSRLNTK